LNRFTAYGREMIILCLIFLVNSLAVDMTSPVWSIYITGSLGASMTNLGFVFSLSNGVAAIAQILSGFLSDRYGRKTLHVLGTLLSIFPPIMYALASDWTNIIPWVMLSGLATGLYLPIRWAMVADVSPSKAMASAYSWSNISWLIGSTVAPFAGGLVADTMGIRFPFIACFLLRLAVFPLALLMKETRRKTEAEAEKHENEHSDVTQKYTLVIVSFSLINIVQGLGIGVTGPIIPVFVLTSFNLDYTFIGILYAIGFGVASIIVQMPGSKCSDLFDRRKVMFITFVASSPFFLLFAYSRNSIELIAFMFLSNAILNLPWAAFQTLMMDATPSSKWGLVNGVSATTFWIGLLTGNALSGILWDNWGTLAPFYASFIAVGLSAMPLLLLKETRVKPEHSKYQEQSQQLSQV